MIPLIAHVLHDHKTLTEEVVCSMVHRLLSPMSNIVNPTEDLVTVLTVGKAQIFEHLAPPLLTSQEPLFPLHGHHDP